MLLTTQVAGFRHDGGNAALGGLGVGSELDLRREPGNVHDSGAIAVYTLSGTKLGYVPRKSNAIPSRLADAGFGLRARVAAIHPAPAPPWERLTVTVEVERG
ncbi:MAG: HIRAN domain-containing protein [Acidobacteria bacterium]|nr:HIRAN domain-containing protein [Acidobacteriota bacterium]